MVSPPGGVSRRPKPLSRSLLGSAGTAKRIPAASARGGGGLAPRPWSAPTEAGRSRPATRREAQNQIKTAKNKRRACCR